jgi:hypothetical protein
VLRIWAVPRVGFGGSFGVKLKAAWEVRNRDGAAVWTALTLSRGSGKWLIRAKPHNVTYITGLPSRIYVEKRVKTAARPIPRK